MALTHCEVIKSTKGEDILVDKEDYSFLLKFNWTTFQGRNTRYAGTTINGKFISLHQLLLKPQKGKVIDHIDHNGLNNCKSNLRYCTHHENRLNSSLIKKKNNTSFKGIYKRKCNNKFCVKIQFEYSQYNLGDYSNVETAKYVYNLKAKELFKDFAALHDVIQDCIDFHEIENNKPLQRHGKPKREKAVYMRML